MSFTVRAVLRTNKENQSGQCPVSICITVGGKRTYRSTGISVTPSAWDTKNAKIRRGADEEQPYNRRLANLISEIRKELMSAEDAGEVLTKRKIKALGGEDEAADFYAYAYKVASGHTNPGTKRRREISIANLKAFAGASLAFSDITPVFLTKFSDYLLKQLNYESNTTISDFNMIRAVFNHARERGVTKHYPFADWQIPKYQQPVKKYLTLEECGQIETLLQGNADRMIKKVSAFFLLECYSGIRFSDWSRFQTERLVLDEHFFLTATKNGEPIYLPLKDSPRLAATVDYIRSNGLTWTESNEYANRMLKVVGPAAGITKTLTTHVGRHTAATLLLEKGFSRETVAQVLGVTMKIIDQYAKMTRQKVKMEFERIGGL